MPLMNQNLLDELVQREIQKDKTRARFSSPAPTSSLPVHPISPLQAGLSGAALDGFSTYKFLHDKSGTEGNKMMQGMGPKMTGLAVGLVNPLVHYAVAQKWPKLANLLRAQEGAQQMGFGGENLMNSHSELGSDQRLSQKLDESTRQNTSRKR